MQKIKQNLSKKLRSIRQQKNITQLRAAELLGMSVRWYQKLEYGESSPNLVHICMIEKQFGFAFMDLFTGTIAS